MSFLKSYAEVIGNTAAFLTTTAFLPQVLKTWRMRTHEKDELSGVMLALFGSGVGLWFIYGYLRDSNPLMLANGITGMLVIAIAGIRISRVARRARRPAPADSRL